VLAANAAPANAHEGAAGGDDPEARAQVVT